MIKINIDKYEAKMGYYRTLIFLKIIKFNYDLNQLNPNKELSVV